MPVIFANNTGKVISIEDKVSAGTIQLGNVVGIGSTSGNTRISYDTHNTIITRIGVAAAGNFQFLHTIGNDVYIYVFGDRMGQVQLHGLSFANQCGGEPTAQGGIDSAEDHGFERLFRWYTDNRIAAQKAPVRVTIGRRTNFNGFVTALSGDVQDALYRTIQFQMTISLLPDSVA